MSRLAHSIQRLVCQPGRGWHSGIAIVLGLLWPLQALACTQPPGGLPTITIAQRVRAADVVLQGTITQVTTILFPDDTATIEVQQYYKGSGPATVTITGFGPSAMCRSQVKVGDTWIFFAKGNPNETMNASYLSQGDAVAAPDADTIAQIIAALNSVPRAYLPLATRAGSQLGASAPAGRHDSVLIGSALLVVVASALLCSRLARAGRI